MGHPVRTTRVKVLLCCCSCSCWHGHIKSKYCIIDQFHHDFSVYCTIASTLARQPCPAALRLPGSHAAIAILQGFNNRPSRRPAELKALETAVGRQAYVYQPKASSLLQAFPAINMTLRF
jgi:hypothetical protein